MKTFMYELNLLKNVKWQSKRMHWLPYKSQSSHDDLALYASSPEHLKTNVSERTWKGQEQQQSKPVSHVVFGNKIVNQCLHNKNTFNFKGLSSVTWFYSLWEFASIFNVIVLHVTCKLSGMLYKLAQNNKWNVFNALFEPMSFIKAQAFT